MDWTQVLTIAASNIALFLWARTESRADHRALESWTKQMISSIQSEIKDFHGRLERQDAEFKGRLEKQDAEFKSHIMHCHNRSN